MVAVRRKSAAEVARNMSAIRSTGNLAERALCRRLHALGFRFRKHSRTLEGRPDIVFGTERIAVFVDGDYWHARLLREQGPVALRLYFADAPRRDYWIGKFERRVVRDITVGERLAGHGWMVLRIWESDIRRDPGGAANRVVAAVLARRGDLARLSARDEEYEQPEFCDAPEVPAGSDDRAFVTAP